MNVLTDLFEVVSEIITDTDIPLSFHFFRWDEELTTMYWYIGPCDNPSAGDANDTIDVGALDEDKLCRWVTELQAILDDYNTPLDKDGLPIDDDHDRWQNNEEDSLDEIASRENHLIDSQEDTQI